jgi:hypothetical protein
MNMHVIRMTSEKEMEKARRISRMMVGNGTSMTKRVMITPLPGESRLAGKSLVIDGHGLGACSHYFEVLGA